MTTSELVQVLTAAGPLLAALAALIHAQAAHRKLDDHVSFKHDVASSIAQKPGPPSGGDSR